MYHEIETLKKKIRDTYKSYIGGEKDKTISLLDIAKYFNIPIDSSRVQDYIIEKIDCDRFSIRIKDTQKNITYEANYTGNANLLDYHSCNMRFNRLIITAPTYTQEILYTILQEKPIITQLTFTNGEYELTLTKEMPNCICFFITDRPTFTVRYSKSIEHDGKQIKLPLLTKIFMGNREGTSLNETFEQSFNYGFYNFAPRSDIENKYTYTREGRIIHGVIDYRHKDVKSNLNGVCFEVVPDSIDNYLPDCDMYSQNYPGLQDKNTISAIIFKGITTRKGRSTLEIYKNSENIEIHYLFQSFLTAEVQEETVEETFNLSRLNGESISSEEIEMIIAELQKRYADNEFINIASSEMKIFGEKIDIRKGNKKEKLDPISPKLLTEKTFEELASLVSSNKEEYFKLMDEQFREITRNVDEKGKIKKLRN